ncbi:MAG: DUF1353 domain-containing protein [Pirellulales bacterium]
MKLRVHHHQFEPSDGMHLLFDAQTNNKSPYVTTREHTYTSGIMTILVPVGFRFDMASVPGWLLWLFDPRGRHQRAAMYHDAVYSNQHCTRFEADALFRAIMKADNVPKWRVLAMFWAVRIFGGKAWKNNRKKI